MSDVTNEGVEETPKKKNKFCKRLHSNEEILQELAKGYLFHSGDGKVKYRTFEAVEKYDDENELHADAVKTQPERRQQTGR
jgi:hypothetical protein